MCIPQPDAVLVELDYLSRLLRTAGLSIPPSIHNDKAEATLVDPENKFATDIAILTAQLSIISSVYNAYA